MTRPEPIEQMIILELPVGAWCPNGVVTLRALAPGLGAVLERLEYGAAKHPTEPWRGKPDLFHVVRLYAHVEALKRCAMPADAPEVRRHLSAIIARALMALTVMPEATP